MDHQSRPSSPSRRPSATSQNLETPQNTAWPLVESESSRQRSLSADHDGRPASAGPGPQSSRRSSIGQQSRRSQLSSTLRRTVGIQNGRPDSCAKPRMPPTSEASATPSVRQSRASSIGNFRAESPYQGATGPSHPYGMYNQDTNLSRVTSSATDSNFRRPERTYSGPRGPTQPYAMYPQNTVSEDDVDPYAAPRSPTGITYPAGSRPAPQAQHRRLGPDGEDVDDLIGPYGFAEQLPPYTRYANDIPPKQDPDASRTSRSVPSDPSAQATAANTASAPTSDQPQYTDTTPDTFPYFPNHPTNSPPNLAIRTPSVSHHDPESQQNHAASPAVADDRSDMTPRSNPFSDTSTQGSSTAVASNISSTAEKGSLKERARKLPKKRICWGIIPCWVIAVLLAICIAILVGGIIGGVLAQAPGVKAGPHRTNHVPAPSESAVAQPTTTVTSIIPAQTPDDVSPLPTTGTTLPALPTGSFTVTLDEPWTTTNSCLVNPGQNNAWDCSNGASLNIVIQVQNNIPNVALTYPPRLGQAPQYGAQPPQLNGPSSLLYMRDKSKSDFKRGPAYVFQQAYDKRVIVRSQDFPGAVTKRGLSTTIKRWLGLDSHDLARAVTLSSRTVQQSDWNMTNFAVITDRPWVCTWNATLLSGYIYVTQGVSEAEQYPKSMKIMEKRPSQHRIPASCQQMMFSHDFQMMPILKSDGTPNIVPLNEVVADDSDDSDDDGPPTGSRRRAHRLRRDMPVGGPNCECAWQST